VDSAPIHLPEQLKHRGSAQGDLMPANAHTKLRRTRSSIMMHYFSSTRRLLGAAYSDVLIDYEAGYTMSREHRGNRISGRFLVKPDLSYLRIESELFNGFSAAILFNQVALAALLETDDIGAREGLPGLGRLLLRTVTIDCKKTITPQSPTDFVYEYSFEPHGSGCRYRARMLLSGGAFVVEGSGVLSDTDHRRLPAEQVLATAS
jgi:hypothetical protein